MNPHVSFRRRAALTLLEMMVAVTLLALIMIGLLAMFQQVQKALHVAHAQTDVFENARGAMQIIARDLSEMASCGPSNTVNAIGLNGAIVGNTLPIPGQAPVKVRFEEIFYLTRANDDWQGIGFFVAEDEFSGKTNTGVGTLYRTSTNVHRAKAPTLYRDFLNPDSETLPHRISDGIVHFAFVPTYPVSSNRFVQSMNSFTFPRRVDADTIVELPAYVDVEIGVLEPATLKQFRALQDFDGPAAQNFLRNNVGRIHFFRERVPIRNFVNPYRANEVP